MTGSRSPTRRGATGRAPRRRDATTTLWRSSSPICRAAWMLALAPCTRVLRRLVPQRVRGLFLRVLAGCAPSWICVHYHGLGVDARIPVLAAVLRDSQLLRVSQARGAPVSTGDNRAHSDLEARTVNYVVPAGSILAGPSFLAHVLICSSIQSVCSSTLCALQRTRASRAIGCATRCLGSQP